MHFVPFASFRLLRLVGYTGLIYDNGNHKVLAYGTKGVRGIADYEKDRLAEWARDKYRDTPYFPKMNKNRTSKMGFLERWSRKDNLDSVYCSKLVWLIFYEYARIDLDSNRTKWRNWNLCDSNGCWVGVSPDDIWGSDHTTAAYDLVRVDMLTTPTSGL